MKTTQPMEVARANSASPNIFLRGAAYGVSAVTIWAGMMVFTRMGVRTSLTPFDLAALRFGVAGLVLLPVVIRRGWGFAQLGWRGFLVLTVGAGAPYGLVGAFGLRYAPAADAGVLASSVMTLFVAVMSWTVLRERIPLPRIVGLACIAIGATIVVGGGLFAPASAMRHVGQALLLLAALMWAAYTVAMRRGGLTPLHAVALVSVTSLLGYIPLYVLLGGARHLLLVPPSELLFQAVFQGVIGTVVSLFLYGKAVAYLGASRGGAFGALVPALAALFAIPLLDEIPTMTSWLSIVFASAGVYLACGGPIGRVFFAARVPDSIRSNVEEY
jgi:drug/metabolite transporter (DMT)-like permease